MTKKIQIHDKKSVELMYKAGRIAAKTLDLVEDLLKDNPYVTTNYIDKICHEFIREQGGAAECVGYVSHMSPVPYNHATCISVNDVACHGVPSEYRLKDGDIVNVDLVVRFPGNSNGWLADTSRSFGIGKLSKENENLLLIAKNAMYAGMKSMQSGNMYIRCIGESIQKYCTTQSIQEVSVIPDFCGHGVSRSMHEAPLIQHVANTSGVRLMPYQYFTIEPIIVLGKNTRTYTTEDKWTIKTESKLNAAQFEHTMCVDSDGNLLILTSRDPEHEQQILKEMAEL